MMMIDVLLVIADSLLQVERYGVRFPSNRQTPPETLTILIDVVIVLTVNSARVTAKPPKNLCSCFMTRHKRSRPVTNAFNDSQF